MTSWAAQQRKARIARLVADAKAREWREQEAAYRRQPGYEEGPLSEQMRRSLEVEREQLSVEAGVRIRMAKDRAQRAAREEAARLTAEHKRWMERYAAREQARTKQAPARQRPAARRSRGDVETRAFDGGTWRIK